MCPDFFDSSVEQSGSGQCRLVRNRFVLHKNLEHDVCSIQTEALIGCMDPVLPEISKFLAGESFRAGSTIEIPAPREE